MSMLSQPDQPTLTGVPSQTDVESCRTCGSPVSREQRYCMSCGKRREDQAVPFAQSLAPETQVASAAAPAAAAAARITPLMGVAIVCASVLFLGVGVLVGRSSYKAAPTAAVPQQVQTIAADGAAGAGGDAAAAGGAAGGAKAATDGQAKAAPPPVLSGAAKAAVERATKCKTPKECQEASKKMPNEYTTPGKPPPVDGKAPAGGAQGQTFQ